MKALIVMVVGLMIIGLVAVGCGKSLIKEDVVGSYELKVGINTFRHVYLTNGMVEYQKNGKKVKSSSKWYIEGNEIHVEKIDTTAIKHKVVHIYRLNKDNSLTEIASIQDGSRTDHPIYIQQTYKRIK